MGASVGPWEAYREYWRVSGEYCGALCTKTFVDITKYFVVASLPMKQDPRNQPTPSELELLQILWTRGPSTVREIHEELSKEKDVGYTSALKLLQIMTTKGYVTRTEDQRAHVYAASDPAEKTKQQFAADVLQRVFRGSASQLMQHALAGRRGSKKELDEIRRLLEEYERKLP
jgi:BlaI family transcriptional regulator, penicillinase repressor